MNSNTKGKSYERKIAKTLSEWSGMELIRTPMSGAWAGTSGDIIPKEDNTDFPFLIECKKNEDWTLDRIFNGNSALFNSWLEQIYKERNKDFELTGQRRFPLLIFSRNRQPDYVACLHAGLGVMGYNTIMFVNYPDNKLYDSQWFMVVRLEEFLTKNFADAVDFVKKLHFGEASPTTD